MSQAQLRLNLLNEADISLYAGLRTNNVESRKVELQRLYEVLRLWAENQGLDNYESQLIKHLPVVLRLSRQSPFSDVRTSFQTFLDKLEQAGHEPIIRPQFSGPSRYLKDFVSLSSEDAKTLELFRQMFLHDGRVTHMVQILMHCPEFLRVYIQNVHVVMRSDGPLPQDWRHYIAILAVSRHDCSYLLHVLSTQFLSYGGDPLWLEDIQYAPVRIQKLQLLNCITAHRPWSITRDHIKDLVRGADNWSMSELAQIGVIFTHYHSLCGIVYGLGLTPELDSVGGYFLESRASNGASNSSNNHTQPHANGNTHPHAQGSVPGHGQYVDDLSVNSQDSLVWAPRTAELLNEGGRGSGEDEGEDMDCVESEEAQNEGDARRMDAFTNSETLYDEIKSEDTDRLSMDTRVGDGWPCAHEDFDQKQHSPLRIQDYSWQDQAFSTLNGFLGGVAQLFDDEFKVAIEMTDNHLGLSQVDTTRFRRAIWFYIHRTCGILHDDYDYSEVNKLVERPLKSFIKRITCYPKTTTMKDFLGCRAGLRDAETVHISILATEARKQAELLFFLRALAEYMNS